MRMHICRKTLDNKLRELWPLCVLYKLYHAVMIDASIKTMWYSRVLFLHHEDVIKWKNFPHYWPFVRGIHRSPVNSPHKGQWRGALMFSLIYAWIYGWVNNREVGDLRRHRAHYDVTIMMKTSRRGNPFCIADSVWGNPPFAGGFPPKGTVLQTLDVSFVVGVNSHLSTVICSVRKMILICLMQNIDMYLLYKSHQIARLVSHLINYISKWMFTM